MSRQRSGGRRISRLFAIDYSRQCGWPGTVTVASRCVRMEVEITELLKKAKLGEKSVQDFRLTDKQVLSNIRTRASLPLRRVRQIF